MSSLICDDQAQTNYAGCDGKRLLQSSASWALRTLEATRKTQTVSFDSAKSARTEKSSKTKIQVVCQVIMLVMI